MILSVSRRTDIPAYYSEWFFNRLKEGFVYVRNPMNIHQVSKIQLAPDVIDCIVFWSKNPRPMLTRLDELKDYMYYFQYTINAYDRGMEVGVPKKEEILNTFKALSDALSPKRVIWRYDPILLTDKMGLEYHERYFAEIAKRLEGYTNTCVISFVDLYKKTQKNLQGTQARALSFLEMTNLAARLYSIANQFGISIQTCAETIELESVGIKHGKCIDNTLIEDLLGVKLVVSKDPNQRKECGCVQSIDIGEYNTCAHGCKYCYANFRESVVVHNRAAHDPKSPLLIGTIGEEDCIKERKLFSFIKLPEPFEVGDIVQLRNPAKYQKTSDFHNNGINLYKVVSFYNGMVKLADVRDNVPRNELLPVAVNGVEDRLVYYEPIVETTLFPLGKEVSANCSNHSYFMDVFEHTYHGKKTLKDLVQNNHLVFVHDIQHYLRKKFDGDHLQINDYKQ